ncbi:MAG TPA: FAD-linked oxidase C-terminal domain-containing protein [Anaerolineales bacterium]|nr:FAD-linked oxidase C-terminal domain-containing protein [Anaerolineales bacterium]
MLDKKALEKLTSLISKQQVLTDPVELLVYERDAALDRGLPDAVVFAHNQRDVHLLAQWAAEFGIPIISRGAGTGLSGGAVAESGGVILAFSRMNKILEIDPTGPSASVEPGVINLDLDEKAKKLDLYYPPDPASGRSATLGGNVAENAGGPHCFKYGVTTNYITSLEFVLAGGEVFTSGGRAYDYPEYDWNGLITGSEGTLAIITKIRTRLLHQPPGVMTMMAAFDSVEIAGAAVSAVISAGLVPATMEMMDQKIARIIEEYAHPGISTEAGALLIIEVDGYLESLQPQINEISSILHANGGYDLRIAQTSEERERIWYARKSAAGAMARLAPAYLLLDGTVPRSLLAQALETSNQICEKYGLQVGYVFHAGDGNLHPFILTDHRDKQHLHIAHQAGREFMQAVVALGGSITGEHGVGIEKRPYLSLMYSSTELSIMRDIKQVFDPQELLNPKKIFPQGEKIDSPSNSSGLVLPPHQFAPSNPEQAAEGLVVLSKFGEPVSITGEAPMYSNRADRILSTYNLHGIQTFALQDMYITAGAGTKVEDIQVFLEQEGWQINLRAPWSGATLGGVLASNFNSPLRMRYGALRDQVLAMNIVLADGRMIRAGRPVVKNVAGYDIPKALVGSYGSLGLITDVTLKINALPRMCRSLVFPVDQLKSGLEWAQACNTVALISTGIVISKVRHTYPIETSPYILAYSLEGQPEDVESEINLVKKMLAKLGAPEPLEIENAAAIELWSQLLYESWNNHLVMRTGIPPQITLGFVLSQKASLDQSDFLLDVASGLLYSVSDPSNLNEALSYLNELRGPALAADGYSVVLGAHPEWTGELDRWGYQPSTIELMKRLKDHWDPKGILNPGMFRY